MENSEIKVKTGVIKTITDNNRLAKTYVFKPNKDMVVIQQRVLVSKQDVADGWFEKHHTIYEYGNMVLREMEIVFWQESFDAIVGVVDSLKTNENNLPF